MDKLTPKQTQVLSAIQLLSSELGHSPTLEEIREHLGYGATSSVQVHLDALEKKGYINRAAYGHRNIRVSTPQAQIQIPLVGNVACGNPILAEENIEAYITYPASKLRGDQKEYFFLRAKGDSMDKAGINDGDFVLIKKASIAQDGQLVVALLGDGATIKKLETKQDYYVLQPESKNPQHKPIYVFEDFLVQGVVQEVLPMN